MIIYSNKIQIKFVVLFLLSFIFILSSCRKKPVKTSELIYRTNSYAFFTVKRKGVKQGEKLLPEKFSHPLEIEKEKIKDILGNLEYEKSTQLGSYKDYIFTEAEMVKLTEDLSYALKSLKEDNMLYVISKVDSTKSVLSKEEVTDMLIWQENENLNLVFGNIKEDILKRDVSDKYRKWSKLIEAALSEKLNNTVVKDSTEFKFKFLNGFPHRKWIVFDKAQVEHLVFKERKANINGSDLN